MSDSPVTPGTALPAEATAALAELTPADVNPQPITPGPEYGIFAQLGAEAFGTFVLVFAGVGTALYAGIAAVLLGWRAN